jgi:hypothetical protein
MGSDAMKGKFYKDWFRRGTYTGTLLVFFQNNASMLKYEQIAISKIETLSLYLEKSTKTTQKEVWLTRVWAGLEPRILQT